MATIGLSDFQIVKESIAGKRAADERTFASLATLQERLERLQEPGGSFSQIEFSPAVKNLSAQRQAIAV